MLQGFLSVLPRTSNISGNEAVERVCLQEIRDARVLGDRFWIQF